MHFADDGIYAWENHGEERKSTPLHPGCGNLRRAIRGNIVSFPSQVPIFVSRPSADMQRRAALLYFVRGWSTPKIARRFNVPKHRIWTLLNEWAIRALAIGYVQVIDPEAFAACCRTDIECGIDHDSDEAKLAGFRPVVESLPQPFPDAAPAIASPLNGTPDGTGRGSWLDDSPGQGPDLIAALDVAIVHCEEWRGEFRVRTAALARDPRTVTEAAVEVQRSDLEAEGFFTAFECGAGSSQNGLRVRDEERVSHAAVA